MSSRIGLVNLLRRSTTPKPELQFTRKIKGTSLIEGSVKRSVNERANGGIVIYDSRTNQVLFGGKNSDLEYIGRLNRTHIARKQEKIDGNWKTYFVDESGKIIFGKKYDSEALILVDSTSDKYVDIDLNELADPSLQKDKLKGSENTLIEYIQNNVDKGKGVLNIYDNSGKLLATNIPAFIEETENDSFSYDSEIIFPVTKLCFVNIEGQLLLEVKYDQKSEIYELN